MDRQLKILRRFGASDDLISHFREKCEINDRLPKDEQARPGELLKEACRNLAFHDILPDGWFFRPYTLGGRNSVEDGFASGKGSADAIIEQAYRRGFTQGFAECRRLVNERATLKQLAARERELGRWRRRNIQKFGTRPGDMENLPRNPFTGRSGVNLRLRFEVLKRDGYRCQYCGKSPADGISLEVDHRIPVARGGTDDLANLLATCNLCNQGKSDRE